MQNFIEIHQRNPELLSSGGFRPPPRLDRGIERPRLGRVNTNQGGKSNMKFTDINQNIFILNLI